MNALNAIQGVCPKVLHVSRVGFLGGVERVIVTLAAERGDVGRTIVAGPGGEALERLVRDAGATYEPAPIERSRITANLGEVLLYPRRWRDGIRAIDRICADHAPDVIQAHHPITVLQAAPAARRQRIPIVFHVHEIGPPKPPYRAALALALRQVSHVACVSSAGRDLVRQGHPPRALPVEIVHNGVDPAFVRKADTVPPAALGAGGPHVGVFGVLEPRKGQDVFLRAAARLRNDWPEVMFWIVGQAALRDKKAYVDGLEALAASSELAGAVRFTGYRDDMVALMKAMDVVVQPSVEHESLSMVLLEALTLGRPVVGTHVGGSAEAVRDGETGLLVPPRDEAALVRAIGRALGPDGRAMGRAAAVDAAARFSTARFVGDFERIYASLCVKRGTAI